LTLAAAVALCNYCAVDGPAVATDNSVVLNFNGKEEKIRLINNQIQISAVKDAFNLRTVQLNGLTEPVDQLGYTVAEFSPGTVITVSGAPTTGKVRCFTCV
jgi:hypothetical protein